MLGISTDCFDDNGVTGDNHCLSYCDFVRELSKQYGVIGIYGTDSVNLNAVISALLERAYQTYLQFCNAEFSASELILSFLDTCFSVSQSGCVTICYTEYKTFSESNCPDCNDNLVTDNFLMKVSQLIRLSDEMPNRELYDQLEVLFGWEFVYSESGIYVISDPIEFFTVKQLIPTPIGEELIPVQAGC